MAAGWCVVLFYGVQVRWEAIFHLLELLGTPEAIRMGAFKDHFIHNEPKFWYDIGIVYDEFKGFDFIYEASQMLPEPLTFTTLSSEGEIFLIIKESKISTNSSLKRVSIDFYSEANKTVWNSTINEACYKLGIQPASPPYLRRGYQLDNTTRDYESPADSLFFYGIVCDMEELRYIVKALLLQDKFCDLFDFYYGDVFPELLTIFERTHDREVDPEFYTKFDNFVLTTPEFAAWVPADKDLAAFEGFEGLDQRWEKRGDPLTIQGFTIWNGKYRSIFVIAIRNPISSTDKPHWNALLKARCEELNLKWRKPDYYLVQSEKIY